MSGIKRYPAPAVGASVTVSDTPPLEPQIGDLWYESDTGKTFVYTDSSWVEVGGGIKGDTGAQGEPGPAGADGGWSTAQTIKAENDATYIAISSDLGKLVTLDNAANPLNVTINSSLGLTTGQRIDFAQLGTGQVVFVASGVTLNATPGFKLRARYSAATLVCLSSNNYILIGDLSA